MLRCWELAASYYLSVGQGDRATECYEKAAKYLESEQKYSQGVTFLALAIEQYKSDNRLRFALDSYRKCLQMLLRGSDYTGAVTFLDKQIRDLISSLPSDTTTINRACVACMIICAKMGDPVEMEKRFVEYQELSESLFMSDEGQIATTLLDAYRTRDQDLLSSILKKQAFLFMDNEVVRVAKSLRVPGAGNSSLPPINATAERSALFQEKDESVAPAVEQEDFGLC